MKRILVILILLISSLQGKAQIDTLSGYVTRLNGDTVKNFPIRMVPGQTVFQPQNILTDNKGYYEFELRDSLTPYPVYVEVLNCDSTIKRDSFVYTGNNITQGNITLCFVAPPKPVSGYVYLGSPSNRPLQATARVYMIQHCKGLADSVSYIDSVLTDTNGYYSFANYPVLNSNCELMMKARLLPQAAEYDKYLPAYYYSDTSYELKWHNAIKISNTAAESAINILLPEAMNPFGGPSLISGTAYYSGGGNNVIKDRLMFITDMFDVPVAYTYTNTLGKFFFNNLQFGTYKIFGDAWNVENLDFVVTVDANNVYVQNVIFTEDSQYYKAGWPASVGTMKGENAISIYPNPANDILHVRNISDGAILSFKDVTGKEIMSINVKSNTEEDVNISELNAGIYLLNITTDKATETRKFIKR